MFNNLSKYFYYNKVTDDKTSNITKITDEEVKLKSIQEINNFRQNESTKIILTNESLHNAYLENNIEKMKYLKNNFKLKLPSYGYYHVDVSVEEGNEEMAKFLVNEFKIGPSLCSKQMALINGHTKLVLWLDNFSTQRNNIGLHNVYRTFDKKTGKAQWSDSIPLNFRYL